MKLYIPMPGTAYYGKHYSVDTPPLTPLPPRPLPLLSPRLLRHSDDPCRGTNDDNFLGPPTVVHSLEPAPDPDTDASFDRLNLDAPLEPENPAPDAFASQRVSQMSLPPLMPLTSTA